MVSSFSWRTYIHTTKLSQEQFYANISKNRYENKSITKLTNITIQFKARRIHIYTKFLSVFTYFAYHQLIFFAKCIVSLHAPLI